MESRDVHRLRIASRIFPEKQRGLVYVSSRKIFTRRASFPRLSPSEDEKLKKKNAWTICYGTGTVSGGAPFRGNLVQPNCHTLRGSYHVERHVTSRHGTAKLRFDCTVSKICLVSPLPGAERQDKRK